MTNLKYEPTRVAQFFWNYNISEKMHINLFFLVVVFLVEDTWLPNTTYKHVTEGTVRKTNFKKRVAA